MFPEIAPALCPATEVMASYIVLGSLQQALLLL